MIDICKEKLIEACKGPVVIDADEDDADDAADTEEVDTTPKDCSL